MAMILKRASDAMISERKEDEAEESSDDGVDRLTKHLMRGSSICEQ